MTRNKRLHVGVLCVLTAALASAAGSFRVRGGATFTVEAPRVRVETDRYAVEFLDLGISQIADKRTGRAYCRPGGMTPGGNASLFLKSFMPAQPERTFRHLPDEPDAQAFAVKRLPRGVECTITGLVHPGDEATRRYHPEAMLGLRIEYDAKTGDLALTPLATAGVPERFGVYDEGILGIGFNLGPLGEGIRLVHPGGMPAPIESLRSWQAWWPVDYPVALMVFQAPGGECAAVWADDGKLDYGKRSRIHDGTVEFHTVNADAPWRVGAMEAPIWRLNLFDSWEPAAMRYREVMERTLGIQPLEEREPAWARALRLITHEVWGTDNFKRYYVDKGVPVEALMEWETQGWLAGYGVELLSKKRDLWFPNYPYERPTRYAGRPDFAARVKERQDFGVAIFPYTLMFYGMSQPFEKDSRVLRAPDMDFTGGGRMWWVLYGNMMEELVKEYGVRGIYDDCSWVGPRYDPRGKVDGLNVYQAHVQGRRFMKERLHPVAFMGERQHEITMVSDFIALLWFMGEVHPINHYLFGPYTLRFNQREQTEVGAWVGRGRADTRPVHEMLDACESLSVIPAVSNSRPLNSPMRQETALINKRMLFWGQQMLTPHFPKRYEPGVLACLRGKDGTEYRTRSGDGIGLVRARKGGEEIVWWRTRNAAEFASPSACIDGWVAYRGEKIIGLNPAHRYVVMGEFTRPEAAITSLPEGCHLTLSRVQDGYWVAAADGANAPPEIELAVASPKRKLTFVGARAASGPDADGTYRVRVAPGGWLAACWGRVPETVEALPLALGEPPGGMQFVADTGLPVFGESGGPLKNGLTGKESFLSWRAGLKGHAMQADYLLRLPKQAAMLKATAVDGGGFEKATVRVRLNGTVVAEIEHAGGAKTPVSASLAAFAGQTVLLTFDVRADGPFGLQDPTLDPAE